MNIRKIFNPYKDISRSFLTNYTGDPDTMIGYLSESK
jgi:hypothetical protein